MIGSSAICDYVNRVAITGVRGTIGVANDFIALTKTCDGFVNKNRSRASGSDRNTGHPRLSADSSNQETCSLKNLNYSFFHKSLEKFSQM